MFGGGYSTRRRSIPFATLQIAAHPPGRLRFPAVGASNTFCVRFSCLITCRSVRFIYIYIYMYVYIYIYISMWCLPQASFDARASREQGLPLIET